MENTNKKSNLFLALVLSLLTALGGAVVFGLVYAIGFYIYFLAIGEIILAYTVFFKKYKNINWKTITFAVIWTVVWTFIFNIFAILVCEAIWIAEEFNVSFSVSFNVLVELWETDPSIRGYMNKRVFEVLAMTILGGIIYGTSYIIQYKKKSKHNKSQSVQPISTSNQQSNTTNEIKNHENELYYSIINPCKSAIEIFTQDKNKEKFKSKILDIKTKLINPLTDNDKETIKNICYKNLSNENISTAEKNAIETLLKIIK